MAVRRISNNTAGQYKRGTAIAINVAFGNLSGCRWLFLPALRRILITFAASHRVYIVPLRRRAALHPGRWVLFDIRKHY